MEKINVSYGYKLPVENHQSSFFHSFNKHLLSLYYMKTLVLSWGHSGEQNPDVISAWMQSPAQWAKQTLRKDTTQK
jgi:hypothetical protein